MARAGEDFAWLTPPILNPTTRVAMLAEAGSGRLRVLGIENEAAATALFSLDEKEGALRRVG